MEFSVPAQADDFRDQVRAFFAQAYPEELRSRRFERPHDKEFWSFRVSRGSATRI